MDDDLINHDVCGATFRYWYGYTDGGPGTTLDATEQETNVTWNGTDYSLRMTYNITNIDGYAGGGMHIENGIDCLADHFYAGYYLTLYAKAGTLNGERPRVTLKNTSDQGGNWVYIDDYGDYTTNWNLFQIPLSEFKNANIQSTTIIERIGFDAVPHDNTDHTWYIDEIWFRAFFSPSGIYFSDETADPSPITNSIPNPVVFSVKVTAPDSNITVTDVKLDLTPICGPNNVSMSEIGNGIYQYNYTVFACAPLGTHDLVVTAYATNAATAEVVSANTTIPLEIKDLSLADPFCWYGSGVDNDRIEDYVFGATFSYWEDYDDDGDASSNSWRDCTVDETNVTWNYTANSFRATYNLQIGGYGGGYMHIETGIPLSNNFKAGAYLSF